MNEIKCNVSNCVYHSGKSTCTAEEIHVACQCEHKACDCRETECGTFEAKS